MKKKIIRILTIILIVWLLGGIWLLGGVRFLSGEMKLASHWLKWKSMKVTHYRFTLDRVCYCNPMLNDATMEVNNGQIVSMTISHREQSSDEVLYQSYKTIDALFSNTSTAIIGVDDFSIRYNETYGFPDNVSIDQSRHIGDDELQLIVYEFEVLP